MLLSQRLSDSQLRKTKCITINFMQPPYTPQYQYVYIDGGVDRCRQIYHINGYATTYRRWSRENLYRTSDYEKKHAVGRNCNGSLKITNDPRDVNWTLNPWSCMWPMTMGHRKVTFLLNLFIRKAIKPCKNVTLGLHRLNANSMHTPLCVG
jgi:hypothetical protein